MASRKETLLKRHRRKKRIAFAVFACLLVATGFLVGIEWALLFFVLAWVVHEVWFSDHLFYAPNTDYIYRFDERLETVAVDFSDDRLTADSASFGENDTLILAVTLRSGWMGRLFDPCVLIEAQGVDGDCQTFERGANGLRYLNLTSFAKVLQEERVKGCRLIGRRCRLEGSPRLWRAAHPDYRQKRLLVIAPHADDAELAAFGLYSQAREARVVTLTAGEVGARHYRRMGLERTEAARLKGRLRAWDSLAVPLWAGVPAERAVQLGYFCLQLSAMRKAPAEAIASSEADLCDTRPFRAFNRVRLASDCDGLPSWNNLLADLREIILEAKPEAIVLPHPLIDSHPDHIAASEAVQEALVNLAWQPEVLLHYANHLSDTDRWPMGEAHSGVTLPPLFEDTGPLMPWALPLGRSCQIDKAMALGMMHDLTTVPLSLKERCRRALQRFFMKRRHPPYGADDYFRRSVRQHELFWVERIRVARQDA
jgi:LmbE family N-acetylglucosaminyl deacetylase